MPSAVVGSISCAYRAATPPATPTATRDHSLHPGAAGPAELVLSVVSGAELGTLALLGAFHGLNPGMGWLFAVSIGLQERSRKALLLSLPFIALGHEGAVALMAVVAAVTRSFTASRVVVLVAGGALLAFGLWQVFRKRHTRWAGMRLSHWGLARWSFVMSSAHGAGLMVLPVFVLPLHTFDGLDTSSGW